MNLPDFQLLGNKGEKSQTSSSALDEPTNVLFLTQLNKDGVACWNTKKDLKPENVALIARDSQRLIFTNDIRVCLTKNSLKLLRDSFHHYFAFSRLTKTDICG